jgi:hypothetical protein
MNLTLVVMPVGSALLGVALGFVAARWVAPWLGWALAGISLLGAVVLVIRAQPAEGMDGLGYFVLAMLVLAPGGLGAALGTVIAALRTAGRGGPAK